MTGLAEARKGYRQIIHIIGHHTWHRSVAMWTKLVSFLLVFDNCTISQRTHDVIITSSGRQNDLATWYCRRNDIMFTLQVSAGGAAASEILDNENRSKDSLTSTTMLPHHKFNVSESSEQFSASNISEAVACCTGFMHWEEIDYSLVHIVMDRCHGIVW